MQVELNSMEIPSLIKRQPSIDPNSFLDETDIPFCLLQVKRENCFINIEFKLYRLAMFRSPRHISTKRLMGETAC